MLFSVIIPTYNRADVISRSINSVLKQSIQDFEILVIDDGSQDNTEDVINEIGDTRIKFIKQNNRGAPSARNNGIKHARGKYVSFLDSDDVWYPQLLEKQKEKYDSDPEISCVYSDLESVYFNGKSRPWKLTGFDGWLYSMALGQGYLSPTIVLSAKRECFDEVGAFDLSLPASQDDDMCFKLAKKYKFGYIPIVLAGVYYDTNNRISSSSNKVALGWWLLWNKYEEDVISFCGNETMAKHYLKCARWFTLCKDKEKLKDAIKKLRQFGGDLSLTQQLALRITLTNKGFLNRLDYYLANYIIK